MNDVGYLGLEFKSSTNEANILTATRDQLENMLSYYEGAVRFHTDDQNPKQIKFFQDGVDLIKKRLQHK